MIEYFSPEMPFLRFARNVALVSIASLLPLLVLYVASQPGFGGMLLDSGPALSRFIRQVATNGLPIVFIVNYIGFVFYARSTAQPNRLRNRVAFVLADMVMRFIAFFVLHAIIYVASAIWFGSFGGSTATALKVIAPTLAQSALFENISGAYLYAILISALPLYTAALDNPACRYKLFSRSLEKSGSLLVAITLVCLFALVITFAARSIAGLQSG